MASVSFQPGFRFSALDAAVLVVGSIAAVALWSVDWQFGFVVAFVTVHFFLFCNVFRMSRPLELLWSGVFVALAGGAIAWETPTWPITTLVSLLATVAVVALEMRRPSYHGILWRRVNPRLPEWWAAQRRR